MTQRSSRSAWAAFFAGQVLVALIFCELRECSVADQDKLTDWLATNIASAERNPLLRRVLPRPVAGVGAGHHDGLTQDPSKRGQGNADYDAGWYRGYVSGCTRVAEESGTPVPEDNRDYWEHVSD